MVIPISVRNVHVTQIQAVRFEFTPKDGLLFSFRSCFISVLTWNLELFCHLGLLKSQDSLGTSFLSYNQKPNLWKSFRFRGLEEDSKPKRHREVRCEEDKEIKLGSEVKIWGNWKEAGDFWEGVGWAGVNHSSRDWAGWTLEGTLGNSHPFWPADSKSCIWQDAWGNSGVSRRLFLNL